MISKLIESLTAMAKNNWLFQYHYNYHVNDIKPKELRYPNLFILDLMKMFFTNSWFSLYLLFWHLFQKLTVKCSQFSFEISNQTLCSPFNLTLQKLTVKSLFRIWIFAIFLRNWLLPLYMYRVTIKNYDSDILAIFLLI